jgi:hypothetical protein
MYLLLSLAQNAIYIYSLPLWDRDKLFDLLRVETLRKILERELHHVSVHVLGVAPTFITLHLLIIVSSQ